MAPTKTDWSALEREALERQKQRRYGTNEWLIDLACRHGQTAADVQAVLAQAERELAPPFPKSDIDPGASVPTLQDASNDCE